MSVTSASRRGIERRCHRVLSERAAHRSLISIAGVTLAFFLQAWVLVPSVAGAAEVVHSELLESLQEKWTGDFDGMIERRRIRVLVVYNKTMYFLNGADQRGITYDLMREFEKFVNARAETKGRPVHVVFIPVSRDELLPALIEGRGDIAAANLTITSERAKVVAFTDPVLSDVKELVVTGPLSDEITSVEGLSGQLVHVRPSSSYFESLARLNARFEEEDKDPAEIIEADENLEDADLMEMVSAGIIQNVIVDSHKAKFWAEVLPDIEVHEDVSVNSGGEIAWAIRPGSPKLTDVANRFIKEHRKGTLMGNLLYKRYFEDNEWIKNATAEKEIEKFNKVRDFFRAYAGKYEFDWLMLAALGYQESRLDHSVRSSAGAIGIMQLLPSTAADPNVGIPEIEQLEHNIHAGTKYLRFLKDRYFSGDGIDEVNKTLLAFASYNAGPGRINGLREKTKQIGLDPNQWFGNVEVLAAREIGAETVGYVSNIYKYYVAYRLFLARLDERGTLGIEEQ